MNDLLHSFPDQESNEPVFVLARPYFVAFLPNALIFTLIILLAIGGQLIFLSNPLNLNPYFANLGILFLGAVQLIVLLVFAAAIIDFYLDIVVITDRRLVDIDQEQLFSRRISELSLEDIEDVTSEVRGFLPTLYNYGTVFIQTAGREDNFRMDNIRHPREIASITLDLAEQAKKSVPEEQRVPESQYVGAIEGKLFQNIDQLKQVGAVLPGDMRRVSRDATQ